MVKSTQKRTFFVYHPAFGYFAQAYNLRQRAVELNGREASAVQQAAIIREAGAEIVVAYVSWGEMFSREVNKSQLTLATALTSAGADVIVAVMNWGEMLSAELTSSQQQLATLLTFGHLTHLLHHLLDTATIVAVADGTLRI